MTGLERDAPRAALAPETQFVRGEGARRLERRAARRHLARTTRAAPITARNMLDR